MSVASRSPHTFDELVRVVRKQTDTVLRKRLGRLKRAASRIAIGPTADALDRLMASGGKRFRAALTVAGYAAIRPRADRAAAVQAGAALELLHAYLLIQDDWMDDDATRRGGPSAHVALGAAYGAAFGGASALLASDLAWGAAIELMTNIEATPARRIAALSVLMRCHQEVVFGQQLDVLRAAEGGTALARIAAATDIETVHALKTGSYTVTAPLLVGAALAGASPRQQRALERFGRPLGVAFQLRDDLLGVFGERAATGKPFAGDIRAGKRTAVTEWGDALGPRARRVFEAAFGNEDASAPALRAAARALDEAGARNRVDRRLRDRCALADRRLAKMAIAPQPRAWLEGAVGWLRGAT
jgi:geranylgeranyl diphosphate synthase type I